MKGNADNHEKDSVYHPVPDPRAPLRCSLLRPRRKTQPGVTESAEFAETTVDNPMNDDLPEADYAYFYFQHLHPREHHALQYSRHRAEWGGTQRRGYTRNYTTHKAREGEPADKFTDTELISLFENTLYKNSIIICDWIMSANGLQLDEKSVANVGDPNVMSFVLVTRIPDIAALKANAERMRFI